MINLGDRVKDRISGLTGIVIGKSDYLFGCRRFGVTPEALTDGKVSDTYWYDEHQIELVAAGAIKPNNEQIAQRGPGGGSDPKSAPNPR